ncbi:Odontogenic ameloblast-associated protein, partial [Galemys pyrenaicus]
KNTSFIFCFFQGPFNSWIPPLSGIPQQQLQTQIPGLSQFSLSSLDQLAKLFSNQVPFVGQVSFAQGTQMGQLEPSQPQTPPQTQQNPSHVMPYVFPFKMPQEQRQILQYYPVYMLLPGEDHQQRVTESPSQTPPQPGQQQFEEQVLLVMPGGQQQIDFEPFIGIVPETAVMPAGGVIPHLQKKMTHFKHASAGISIPSTSQKPTTTNFASSLDPTITPELMEEKVE